eukprot:COSAG04_NODE_703_length_11008_cov_78.417270_1_plen_25_part_10
MEVFEELLMREIKQIRYARFLRDE